MTKQYRIVGYRKDGRRYGWPARGGPESVMLALRTQVFQLVGQDPLAWRLDSFHVQGNLDGVIRPDALSAILTTTVVIELAKQFAGEMAEP